MIRLLLGLALVPLLLASGGQPPDQNRQGQPPRPPQPGQIPFGGPYTHKVLSASSPDGLSWTRDEGVRLEHASVPSAVVAGDRVFLYYVDADRGPGLPESVGCAVSTDGLRFERQPFAVEGLRALKAVDPGIVLGDDGTFRLYYLASNESGDPARESSDHEIHLAVSKDGIRFQFDSVAFSYPALVDPDVFFHKGTWFMYVFAGRGTAIATSADGRRFTYKQMLEPPGWGTVAPIRLADGRLRLYAFDQRTPVGNVVRSFVSENGFDWKQEPGDRMVGGPREQITDPYVVRWKGGYKMYFKSGDAPGAVGSPPPQPGAGARQSAGQPGPWDQDVLVHRVSKGGAVEMLATFERSGVPTIARLADGRLIAATQHFPEDDPGSFDKVAVRFSRDEGRTWTPPRVIEVTGLPQGMRFPFDPTLVPLPGGRVRLYFTSMRQGGFEPQMPAISSAVSPDGVHYTVEPGVRFAVSGRPVIDCAVVLHKGVFHLVVPDNGTRLPGPRGDGAQDGQGPPAGVGYHATSRDGLEFTRADDVRVDGNRRWLGNAQSDGAAITFFGTGGPGPSAPASQPGAAPGTRPGQVPARGGIWRATSPDGARWTLLDDWLVPGADPGAVDTPDGAWIVVSTGPPRPGTPSALRLRSGRRER
jgi:hypothetical protein